MVKFKVIPVGTIINGIIILQDLGSQYATNNSKEKQHYVVAKFSSGIIKRVRIQHIKRREIRGIYTNITRDKNGKPVRLFSIWCAMKARCNNLNTIDYKQWYGCKNIAICKEWNSSFAEFRKWSLNNGYKDNLTIDRIDTFGNYEPDNCRWTTQTAQVRNRCMLRNNTTGYKGVSYCPSSNKTNPFGVQIKVNSKAIYLGCHPTAEQAGEAYDNYIKKNNLEYYTTNKSLGNFKEARI